MTNFPIRRTESDTLIEWKPLLEALPDAANAQSVAGVYTFQNGIKTDTISEETAAAGVTVDGVLLKDSEVIVADEAYGVGWNGSLEVPTKNAVYDKVETIVSDTAYGVGWNGSATVAPSQNAVYDKIESLNLDSGTYTPSGTNVANLGTLGFYAAQYLRVGNTVTVSGKVDVDATSSGVLTQFRFTLPIASNFSAEQQCAGTIVSTAGSAMEVGDIVADATNDRALVRLYVQTAANHACFFHFTYRIV